MDSAELSNDENVDGGESDGNEDESPPKESCCGDQLGKMKSTPDWWSLWIGLASFSLGENALVVIAKSSMTPRTRIRSPTLVSLAAQR